MTHAGICPTILAASGITENMARLSVGLEDIEDLLQDLDQALLGAYGLRTLPPHIPASSEKASQTSQK
jgi:Cys/Met metabolism PLP-dependent enzyme